MSSRSTISIYGARQHNLDNVNLKLPRGALIVITGPSGSGKSSLAFDTIYAEGQRRYVESLSAYARQFLEQMQKPDVDRIEGLPPTIAIEQRLGAAGPRSTVATTTEIHDYLRVLFARAGVPKCWHCERPIVKQSTAQMVDAVLEGSCGGRIMVMAPLVHEKRGSHQALLQRIQKEGFVRVRIDQQVMMLEEVGDLSSSRARTIEVVVDRLVVKAGIEQRLADSLETAVQLSGGRVIIAEQVQAGEPKHKLSSDQESWTDQAYSAALGCPVHPDVRLDELSPQLFSFNSPYGACESCNGLGIRLDLDPDLIIPDVNLSLADGAIAAWRRQGKRLNELYQKMIHDFCEAFDILPDIPYRNIPESKVKILLKGTTKATAKEFGVHFEGVLPNLKRRWETTESESAKQKLHAFLSEAPCQACAGRRLKDEALCVKIEGKNLADLTAMTLKDALTFFEELTFGGDKAKIAQPLVEKIRQRLNFLVDVGVEYLTLDRSSATLSGGEWQRIRLGTQIGSGLAGVCYVLDEPTVGLHPRDTQRLIKILKRLAELDNTVIVVEHDEAVIRSADYLVDIGPGAGARGGRVIAEGSLEEVLSNSASPTARYLNGQSVIALPEQRREVDANYQLALRGVKANNLKNIDVQIPLGRFVCVTGVSGSGKSTLINFVLLRALQRMVNRSGPKPGAFDQLSGSESVDKIIEIDQAPIGRTPRSNPATYVGVFDLIRQLYTKTRQAKIRGYGPARFSFNIKGGRCEACEGQGVKRIAMHFLPDVYVTCGECHGSRYNRETLEVRYRGKTIAEVLALSVEEAVIFFDHFANIRRRLQSLKDVGLGYMSLGQPSNTLSGGEAQRVKLAAELHKSGEGHTVYLLDEPTTGLHFSDVRNLIALLQRLVERGHSVIIIEHNLDVIKSADWVIDLGPEGGEEGGNVVAVGTPEAIAQCKSSYTGRFLKKHLKGKCSV